MTSAHAAIKELVSWSGLHGLCTVTGPSMQATPHHYLEDQGLVRIGVGEDLLVVCVATAAEHHTVTRQVVAAWTAEMEAFPDISVRKRL